MGSLAKDLAHRTRIKNLPVNGQTVDQSKRPVRDMSKLFRTYENGYKDGECDGSFNQRQKDLHLVLNLRAQVKNLWKKVRLLENK